MDVLTTMSTASILQIYKYLIITAFKSFTTMQLRMRSTRTQQQTRLQRQAPASLQLVPGEAKVVDALLPIPLLTPLVALPPKLLQPPRKEESVQDTASKEDEKHQVFSETQDVDKGRKDCISFGKPCLNKS